MPGFSLSAGWSCGAKSRLQLRDFAVAPIFPLFLLNPFTLCLQLALPHWPVKFARPFNLVVKLNESGRWLAGSVAVMFGF
jgi:hypothetical protein